MPTTYSPRRDPTRALVENCVKSRVILEGLMAGCGASCRCPGCGETGFDTTSCRRCGYAHAVHCFSPGNQLGGMMSPKPVPRALVSPSKKRDLYVPKLSPPPVVRIEQSPHRVDRLHSVGETLQGSPLAIIASKSPLRSPSPSPSPLKEVHSYPNSSHVVVEVQPVSVVSSPRGLVVDVLSVRSDSPFVINSPVASFRSQSPRRLASPILQHCSDDVISCASPVGSLAAVSVHYSPVRSPRSIASPMRSPRAERRDCSPIRQRVTINERIVENDMRSLRKIRHIQQTATDCMWKGIRRELIKKYYEIWITWAKVFQPDFWEEPNREILTGSEGTMLRTLSTTSPSRRMSASTQTPQPQSPGTPQTPSSPGTCFSQPQGGTAKRSPRVRLRQQLLAESLDFLVAVTGVVCARIVVVKMQAVSYNGIWYKKGTPQPSYLSHGGELVGDLRLSIPAAPLPAPVLDEVGLNAEQLEHLNETCTTGQRVFQPIIAGGSKSESEHKDSVDLTAVAYSLGGSRYGILEPVSAGSRSVGPDSRIRDIEEYRLPSCEGDGSEASASGAADAPSPSGGTPSRQIASRPQKAKKVLSPKPTPLDHYLENRPDTPEREVISGLQDKPLSYLTPQLNPESKHMPSRGTRKQKTLVTKDTPDSIPMPQLSTSSDPQDPDSRHTSDPTIAASVARSDLSIAGAVATSRAVKSLVASIGREVASLGVSQSAISQISHLNLNESTDSADVLAKSAPSPRSRMASGVDDISPISPVPHALTPRAKPCTHLPAKPRRHGSKKLGNQAYPPEEVLDRSGASLSQFNSEDMSQEDDGLPPFTPPQSALSAALFPRRVPPSTGVPESASHELTVADSLDLDPNAGRPPPPVRKPLTITSPDERWKLQNSHRAFHSVQSTHRSYFDNVNSQHGNTPTDENTISHNSWNDSIRRDNVKVMELACVSPLRARRRQVTVAGPPQKDMSGMRYITQQCSRESPRRAPVSDVPDHVVSNIEVVEARGKQDALLLEIERLRSENLALRIANSDPPLPIDIETPIPVYNTLLPQTVPPVTVVHMPIADVDPTTSPHRETPGIVLPVFNPRDFRSERSHERYR